MSQTSHNNESKASPQRLADDKALESLGVVVSEISHEINNILSLISGYVEMAISDISEEQRAYSDLEHVLAATDRAKELVARIRTFSNTTKLDQDAITIDKPVAEAIEELSQRRLSKIEISSDIEPGNGRQILGNATEIYKVVSNLCQNSIQSMPESGGKIKVSVNYIQPDSTIQEKYPNLPDQQYVRICVADNGCGMSMDTIEKMYLPFFTTFTGGEGAKRRAGLGLTTVHNIITDQGGLIYVDSTVGKGTTIDVFLPLIKAEVQDETAGSEAGVESNNKHVLLIDDDASIINMATQMLTSNGYTVTSFLDGNEALEKFKSQPYQFDAIITDLIMPNISGSEVASQISALNPNVPIILSTGFSDKISKSTCASWGVDKVVTKPFKMNELLSAIASPS